MKKLLTLLLCVCMLASAITLIGCGSEDGISINGHSLTDFKVVIPSECDKTTEYAAKNLVLLLKEQTGVELTIITDSEEETECEILVGETNRDLSKDATLELKDKEYLLLAKGSKIVVKGAGIYVGGACNDLVNNHIVGAINEKGENANVKSIPKKQIALEYTFKDTYDSVIFMIGDGMGFQHVAMTEKNKIGTFVGKLFPVSAKSVTRSLSVMNGEAGYTDSAASATAMSTGFKTINKHLGVDENGTVLKNVRELARESGAKTAVITTDVITGATPSAYLCHHPSRHDTEILQGQIDALIANKEIDYIAGDVANDLTLKVAEALELISKDSKFFIMVEEAMIDKASEKQDIWATIGHVARFNDAITYATQFALCHPNVALIVTADHETGKLTPYPALGPGFMFESYSHTNYNVPVYAIGAGVEGLNGKTLENTELAQFSAKAFSGAEFGKNYN